MTPDRSTDPTSAAPAPRVSVVAPAHNEAGNVAPLVDRTAQALADTPFEFILVDDASTDTTAQEARDLAATRPWLRLIRLDKPPARTNQAGGGNGQSAAFKVGFAAARAPWVAVLDADLQNDPADIPAMLALLDETGADFVQGDRSRNRNDNFIRRRASEVGRLFRRLILGDTIRDTGCSLRVMRKEIAVKLPLDFKGMHRFIPATARHLGYSVVEMPVTHHARTIGETKYGKLGITKRAIPGLLDCFAVRWMRTRRRIPTGFTEHNAPAATGTPTVVVNNASSPSAEAAAEAAK